MSTSEVTRKMKMTRHVTADPTNIDALIVMLNNENGLARHQARLALVSIGEPAVETPLAAGKALAAITKGGQLFKISQ